MGTEVGVTVMGGGKVRRKSNIGIVAYGGIEEIKFKTIIL